MVTGGAVRSRAFAQLVADVTGRLIEVPEVSQPAARAGAQLVAGQWFDSPPARAVEPCNDPRYDDGYQRFLDVFQRVRKEEE